MQQRQQRRRRRSCANNNWPKPAAALLVCVAAVLLSGGGGVVVGVAGAPAPATTNIATTTSSSNTTSTTSSSSGGVNPLLSDAPFPLWDQITPADVVPAVRQLLAEEGAALDLLEADVAAAGKNVTYAQVFGPYTQTRMRMDAAFGLFDHLSSVADSPALRAAVEEVSPMRVAFELRFGQSKPLYDAVATLRDTPSKWAALTPNQQRVVELTLRDLKASGVGLAPPQRARFNEIADALQKLTTNFSNNMLDSTAAFKLLLTDKAQVDGLQPSTLATAAQKARAAGHKNATAKDGPWLLTLDSSTYTGVVSFAKDRELRRKVYNAYQTVASSGKVDNAPIIDKLLALRREQSALLGYDSFAADAFTGKMATLPEARKLLDSLGKATRPYAVAEDQRLEAFARNATGEKNFTLMWWDRPYWSERQKEALFKLDQETLRQYLPLDNVLKGLFDLATRMYGIRIAPAPGKLPVWHKDVQVYAVYANASSDQPTAYFYADLYARPGEKQGGAWVQPLWDRAHYWRAASPAAVARFGSGAEGAKAAQAAGAALAAAASSKTKGDSSKAAATASSTPAGPLDRALAQRQAAWLADAPFHPPIAIVVSNQAPPTDGRPSMMTLDDVETLFHEFGHALQQMLTQSKEGLTAGMRGIEWDAVETPSQMMEKWPYDRGTFKGFARKVGTNEPAPDWMYDQILNMQTYRKGTYFAYQLTLANTDLILYADFIPGQGVKASVPGAAAMKTPIQVQHEQYRRLMAYPPNPTDRQLNSFSHIFDGGYAAGYYSYMWADVMSTDAFAAFTEAGTGNATAVADLGRRFRDTVLSLGGSVPPGDVFKRFRGRAPRVEPLLAYNGLAGKPDSASGAAGATAASAA